MKRRKQLGQPYPEEAGMLHALRQSIAEHVYSLVEIAQLLIGGDCMSRIIKEPFAPQGRHVMINYRGEFSRISRLSYYLQRSFIALPKLANASSEDICMVLLLVSLLVTTLLLPWIVL
jgi:hypothetical protein